MLPATGWLGTGAVVVFELLPLALPTPVVGKYRDPLAADPSPGGTAFPFTARIEGAHAVTTEAGPAPGGFFSTLTKLSLLEVFGAMLVDIIDVPLGAGGSRGFGGIVG